MMEKTRHMIAYLPYLCMLLLGALLPFQYSALHRMAFYGLAVTYVLDYVVNRRWQGWQWSYSKLVFLAFGLFVALPVVWQWFDPLHTPLYQSTIETFAPFFFIGLAGFCGMTDKIRVAPLAGVMLTVSTGICGYLGYKATLDAWHGYDWLIAFHWFCNRDINTHMVVNLYFNISLILGAKVLFDTALPRWVKVLTALLMLPVSGALLISDGRTGMITFLLVAFILMLYYIIRARRWKGLIGLLVFTLVTAVFLAHHPRIQETLHTKNPRIEQWKECVGMIEERPVTGYGVCSARDEYVRRVRANEYIRTTYIAQEVESYPEFVRNGEVQYHMMHPHNAFLETWTRFGIVGILLCLFCLFGPAFIRVGKNQIYLVLCVLAFGIQAIFESFGPNLQPLFLASMVLVFYRDHTATVPPSTPTHP